MRSIHNTIYAKASPRDNHITSPCHLKTRRILQGDRSYLPDNLYYQTCVLFPKRRIESDYLIKMTNLSNLTLDAQLQTLTQANRSTAPVDR